ncbi:MAG: hypothetical protein A2306_07260 [Omnitrophica WOR_2 bacterium RIFOXYB2_FULL_38_16]|nr:MAG: hypothetical protein A2267_02520 [Omnitrophica WOR_2 bacterium RIFOXYA12_FULL_38_10]OGX59008.1 MAG: hypothetical protein A2306_07260 [Omnitrophica WOR_2 bacterium RIFOXYB2_FULL_38_16]
MIVQHKDLSQERWSEMTICEQMANIGSEVGRALNWKKKNNEEYAQKALLRALELLSLTIGSVNTLPRYKELTRLKEAILDYFYGDNEFSSTEELWRKYFDHFNYAARRKL